MEYDEVARCGCGDAENDKMRRLAASTVDAASRRIPRCNVSHNAGPSKEPFPPELGFFRQDEDVANSAGNLPHWRQESVTYFVTFRLGDSLPQIKLRQWLLERDAWLAEHPKAWDSGTRDEYHRRFTARFEKWLDEGYGSCVLGREDVRVIVVGALKHFERVRYWLDSWIVMPNHVHVIVTPLPGHELSPILHAWKSYTAHECLKLLPELQSTFWQKESFDQIVRSPEHLERLRAYLAANPKGLSTDRYILASPLDAASLIDAASRRMCRIEKPEA